jgi:hypothetical protein
MWEFLLILFLTAASLAMFTCCCASAAGCTNCSADRPTQMQVVFTNIANATCANCTLLNITVTLPLRTTACADALTNTTDTPTSCRWTKPDNAIVGFTCAPGFTPVGVEVWQQKVGSNYYTKIVMSAATFGGNCKDNLFTWIYDHGTSAPDCEAFSGLSVPWESTLSTECDDGAGTATATVTAL